MFTVEAEIITEELCKEKLDPFSSAAFASLDSGTIESNVAEIAAANSKIRNNQELCI